VPNVWGLCLSYVTSCGGGAKTAGQTHQGVCLGAHQTIPGRRLSVMCLQLSWYTWLGIFVSVLVEKHGSSRGFSFFYYLFINYNPRKAELPLFIVCLKLFQNGPWYNSSTQYNWAHSGSVGYKINSGNIGKRAAPLECKGSTFLQYCTYEKLKTLS
jgi:hypothetical protein